MGCVGMSQEQQTTSASPVLAGVELHYQQHHSTLAIHVTVCSVKTIIIFFCFVQSQVSTLCN